MSYCKYRGLIISELANYKISQSYIFKNISSKLELIILKYLLLELQNPFQILIGYN